jgi:hypothetical protein
MVIAVTKINLFAVNIDIFTRNTGSYARVTHSREYISATYRSRWKYYLAVDAIKINYSYKATTTSLKNMS